MMIDRRRFAESKKKGGIYIPPSNIYWDLAKNVGHVPCPYFEWDGVGKMTTPSLYVEFANPIRKEDIGDIDGFAFLVSGYNIASNASKDWGIVIANSMNLTGGYGKPAQFQSYRIENWRGADGIVSLCVLGGESQGVVHKTFVGSEREETISVNTGWSDRHDGYIKFGCKSWGEIFNPAEYPTNASLLADLDNINGIGGNGECKLRQFIFWHDNTDFMSLEELLANRDNAEVDIRFDSNGNPYNGGTSGDLIFTNVK